MAKDTRTRMLETTARLLQHRGYYGTSLSDILKDSGAPRGSLYFHFPGGKDQLVLEATRITAEQATEELRACLVAARTPAAGVRAYAEAAAAIMRETDFTFGCPVAPVILDASGGLDELAEICRKTLEDWLGLLRRAFVTSGVSPVRARSLALLVVTAIEGGLIVARACRKCDALMTIAAELEKVVTAALEPSEAKA